MWEFNGWAYLFCASYVAFGLSVGALAYTEMKCKSIIIRVLASVIVGCFWWWGVILVCYLPSRRKRKEKS